MASPSRADEPRAAATSPDSLPANVSDHTLAALLQASVDRLKTQADASRTQDELRDREDKRTAIMLKLAQEQVDRAKEANARLERERDASKRDVAQAQDESAQLRGRTTELEQQLKAAGLKHERYVGDSDVQMKVVSGERDALQRSLERLREELRDAKAAAVTSATCDEKKFRELYEKHVTLEARAKTLGDDKTFLEAQRDKETKMVAEREFDFTRTIASHKRRIDDLEAQLQSEQRASFETQTSLKSDGEQLRIKVIQLEGMLKSTDKENYDKIHKLTNELRMLRDRADQDFQTAAAKERALQAETATLAAHLAAAQKEINELSDKETVAQRKAMNDVVQLRAERDALTMRVAALQRELEEAAGKAKAREVELRTDVEVVKNDKVTSDRRHATDLAVKRDELVKLREELSLAAREREDLASAAERKEGDLNATIDGLRNEVARLKVENEGYQQTVEKLDKHVKDNYAVRILEDQVTSLKAQNVQLKNQLTHTNSVLANLRVEADINEGSRMRVMEEQVVDAQRKVAQLERELKYARPLISDLVEVAQNQAALDAGLERDIDNFMRQFGAVA